MARITVEDCLERLDNRFAIIHLTAKRVVELRSRATPMVEAPKNKEVVVALRELAAGKLIIDDQENLPAYIKNAIRKN